MRRISNRVNVGGVIIGGGEDVTVQSMTRTKTSDKEATLAQLIRLRDAGCDIARFTVNDFEAVKSIAYFKERVEMPLVADIHFDYRLALESVRAGIDKIRINPGNIGGDDKVRAVCDACAKKGIPIRVGVNAGSLEKEILRKYSSPTPEAVAESARLSCERLESFGFSDIVVSVKASGVREMMSANRIIAKTLPYPIHLGVTEAGAGQAALVKSAVGIGALLADGIGDTVRVSLTGDVVKEVEAALDILNSLGLRPHIEFISCPTCGRTQIDLEEQVRKLKEKLCGLKVKSTIKVAVMGCAVNGPGEAVEADVGVAGGKGEAILFVKGKIIGKIPEEKIADVLYEEIRKLT